ncbi:MAG: hypothetical protein JXR56_10020 [Candidatus Cloacimonetes bacterium]|nr:hypothetical protein [Candidatus Cloacimonadota bacterium]
MKKSFNLVLASFLFAVVCLSAVFIMHNIFSLEDESYKVSNIITANQPDIEFSPSVAFHSGFLFALGIILFLAYLRNKLRIVGELSILIGIYIFYSMVGVYDIFTRLRFHLFAMSMVLIFWMEFYGYLFKYRRLLTDIVPYILTIASFGVLIAENTRDLILAILYFPYVMIGYFLINLILIMIKFYRHPRFYIFFFSVIITAISAYCWALSTNWFHWNRIGWTIFLTGYAMLIYLNDWHKKSSDEPEESEDIDSYKAINEPTTDTEQIEDDIVT